MSCECVPVYVFVAKAKKWGLPRCVSVYINCFMDAQDKRKSTEFSKVFELI